MTHAMAMTRENGDEKLLECDDCGRVVIVGPGRYEVLVRGDFLASHSWTSDNFSLVSRVVD